MKAVAPYERPREKLSRVGAAGLGDNELLALVLGTGSRGSDALELARHLLPQYGALPVEHFGIVMLDTKHRVLRVKVVSIGSLDATVVHPREVFREAATASASAIVLFHN